VEQLFWLQKSCRRDLKTFINKIGDHFLKTKQQLLNILMLKC